MQNDKITLKDLSVFPGDGNKGVVDLIDRTTTQAGKDELYKLVVHPPDNLEALLHTQNTVKFWHENEQLWPGIITNGTLVMLEKFFEATDGVSAPPSGLSVVFGDTYQKLFNKTEYFFTQFSLSHLSDFLQGCRQLAAIKDRQEVPQLLQEQLSAINERLQHRLTDDIIAIDKKTPYREFAKLAFYARRELKTVIYELTKLYAFQDALHSLAKATKEHNWVFPELLPATPVCFEAKGLWHPLLETAKPYDISFKQGQSFLILTGANMSGKTTFMRSIGVMALLAHIGMGVPATAAHISFFKGIITNMHVEDDLLKGESFFFAEVKRMKLTAERLVSHEPHIVLMDELFKGTNVHDAYECTRGVVEGLLDRPEHMMILSTHLYEVAEHFSNNTGIQFIYFVTRITGENNYHFEYELKKGISNDRIGYRILQKEGVLDMLRRRKE